MAKFGFENQSPATVQKSTPAWMSNEETIVLGCSRLLGLRKDAPWDATFKGENNRVPSSLSKAYENCRNEKTSSNLPSRSVEGVSAELT